MELRGRIRGRRGRGEEGYGEGEGGWEEEERITDSKINAVYNGPVLNYLSNYPFSLIPLSLVSLFVYYRPSSATSHRSPPLLFYL